MLWPQTTQSVWNKALMQLAPLCRCKAVQKYPCLMEVVAFVTALSLPCLLSSHGRARGMSKASPFQGKILSWGSKWCHCVLVFTASIAAKRSWRRCPSLQRYPEYFAQYFWYMEKSSSPCSTRELHCCSVRSLPDEFCNAVALRTSATIYENAECWCRNGKRFYNLGLHGLLFQNGKPLSQIFSKKSLLSKHN